MKQTLREWCDNNGDFGELIKAEFTSHRNTGKHVSINSLGYNSKSIVQWECKQCGKLYTMRVCDRLKEKTACKICQLTDTDIVGSQFGCLTVEEPFAVGGTRQKSIDRKLFNKIQLRHALYVCRCTCKNKKIMSLNELVNDPDRKYCGNDCDNYVSEMCKNYIKKYSRKIMGTMYIGDCIDHSYTIRANDNNNTKEIARLYRCRCYVCGKERNLSTLDIEINPPGSNIGYTSGLYCTCNKEILNINKDTYLIIISILNNHELNYLVNVQFDDAYDTDGKPLKFDICIFEKIDILENESPRGFNPRALIRMDRKRYRHKYKRVGTLNENEILREDAVKLSSTLREEDELRDAFAEKHTIPMIKIKTELTHYKDIEQFLNNALYNANLI